MPIEINPGISSKTFTIIYHKTSSSSISDLTGTKWYFNSTVDISSRFTYYINFTSDNKNCSYLRAATIELDYESYVAGSLDKYDNFSWSKETYRTIEITGGDDATNSELIAWLQANATQVIEPTGHTLTYSGDLSSYLDVKVNNVSVSSGTTINNGDKVEVYLDNSYPNYELLVNDKEITDNTIRVINKDISIEVNEVIANYLTFSSPNTFTLNIVDNKKYWDGTLEYSTDAKNWSIWDGTTTLSSSQSGATKYLYVRGSNNTYITGSSANNTKAKWVLTGSDISCDGNIETILDYQTVANGNHPNMASFCYYRMFYGCTSLIKAPQLSAVTLTNYCYSYLFYGCTSLTTAPNLPTTTLSDYCYHFMFYGCTSLTTAPELPATTLANYCYQYMFYGCTSLTTAPELPATTLADYCYRYMFYDCTSLTTAPALPATTLAQNCYNAMFSNCTSLTTPSKMAGGTTQAVAAKYCCYQMYYNCTSLNIYTSSSGHTPFYKAITYSTSSSSTNYRSSFNMFYNCYIDGVQSTTTYLDAGTQYYY